MGVIPATTETHGPFRKVVDVDHVPARTHIMKQHGWVNGEWTVTSEVPVPIPAHTFEVLECGHRGARVQRGGEPATKRRCVACVNETVADDPPEPDPDVAAHVAAVEAWAETEEGQRVNTEAAARRSRFTVINGGTGTA